MLIGPEGEGEDAFGSRGNTYFRALPGVLGAPVGPVRLTGLRCVSTPLLHAWQQPPHSPLWPVSVWDSLAVGVCLGTAAHSQGCPQCRVRGHRSELSRTELGQIPSWSCSHQCAHRRCPKIRAGRWLSEMALPRLCPASRGRLQAANCCVVTFVTVE